MESMVSEWKAVIVFGILYLFCGAYWVEWRNSIDLGANGNGRNRKKSSQAKLKKVA